MLRSSSFSVKSFAPMTLMAVALERRHGGRDLGAVEAAARVLALQFLLGAVEERLVVDLRFRDSRLLEAVLEVFLGEFLGALDVDRRDRRAFLNVDDEHVAVALQAHVLVEARGVERLDGRRGLLVVDALPDFHGEVGEHGARLGALHALDADVADGEGLDGEGRECDCQYAGEDQAGKQHL
jgi:hypothetical protein